MLELKGDNTAILRLTGGLDRESLVDELDGINGHFLQVCPDYASLNSKELWVIATLTGKHFKYVAFTIPDKMRHCRSLRPTILSVSNGIVSGQFINYVTSWGINGTKRIAPVN